MRRWHLALAVLGFAVYGCDAPSHTVAPRLATVARHYAPGLSLGEPIDSVLARTAGLQLTDELRFTGAVPPPQDGFALRRVALASRAASMVVAELTGQRSRAGTVRRLILIADAPDAGARALRYLTAMLHAPTEGCAGIPGTAVDRVFSWRVPDSGAVALTVPAYRAAGSTAGSRLVLFADAWDGQAVELGYRGTPCAVDRNAETAPTTGPH